MLQSRKSWERMRPHSDPDEISNLGRLFDSLPRPYALSQERDVRTRRDSHEWRRANKQLAERRISQLTEQEQPYLVDGAERYIDVCTRCDVQVNGGYATVITPKLDGGLDIPYMAMHWMQVHNSPDYSGSDSKGKVDVKLLRQILVVT